MPPTRVQPVTQAFLSRVLDRTGLVWTRDPDGDCYAHLSGKTLEQYLQCWFLLEHDNKIFKLSSLVQPVIPWQNLPEAMIQCHRYNETYRFGKLYCQPADEPEAGISLHFEGQLDVSSGISEAFLATYINSHLASVCDFLAKVFKNKQLFGSQQPKPSRKDARSSGKRK
jgi:hypothetical protein